MAIRNEPPVGPAPQYPERDRQTYDVDQASDTRRVWAGPRYAEEQLVKRGNLFGSFYGGSGPEGERRYVAEIADDRHSPLADGSAASRGPSWDMVRPEETSSFASATDFGDPGQPGAPHHVRSATWNAEGLSPISGLGRGERQNTHYVRAKAHNPRNRRNPASIFGAEDVR